jgi:AN1-type zinc finger protein 5/6
MNISFIGVVRDLFFFFRNTLTDSYCSKCFEIEKEKSSKLEPKVEAPVEPAPSSTVSTQNTEDVEMKDADKTQNTPQVVQEHPTRCYKCNVRVGYTIIRCRCGYNFCGKHRYSDTHDCTYDYKEFQQKRLIGMNQKVSGDKVQGRI